MNVLVACEESQRVCMAFRERGHRAFSCDILPCSGGHPEWHIQDDVIPLLNGDCVFKTADTHTHTARQVGSDYCSSTMHISVKRRCLQNVQSCRRCASHQQRQVRKDAERKTVFSFDAERRLRPYSGRKPDPVENMQVARTNSSNTTIRIRSSIFKKNTAVVKGSASAEAD